MINIETKRNLTETLTNDVIGGWVLNLQDAMDKADEGSSEALTEDDIYSVSLTKLSYEEVHYLARQAALNVCGSLEAILSEIIYYKD